MSSDKKERTNMDGLSM